MRKFRHSFDLGIFILYKDNEDGTALFYKDDALGSKPQYIKIESRLIQYHWKEMRSLNEERIELL